MNVPRLEHAAPPAVSFRPRPARRLGVAVRVSAWWHAGELDRRLAAGVDPDGDAALALRARTLTGRRSRRQLADGLTRARHSARDSSRNGARGLSAAIQPHHDEIRAARVVLSALDRRLRAPEPVSGTGAGDAPDVAHRRNEPALRARPRGARSAVGCALPPRRSSPISDGSDDAARAVARRQSHPRGRPQARRKRPERRQNHGKTAGAAPRGRACAAASTRPPTSSVTGRCVPAPRPASGGPVEPRCGPRSDDERDVVAHAEPARAGPRRARDRLRGHRHEPALHRAGHLHASPRRRPPDRGRRLRHRLADLLGADDRRLDQVRGLHHARPQPRRRRDHGADGAGPAPQGAARGRARDARDLRRRAVLRRRHDHAGDLGDVRGRGPERGDAEPRASRRADLAGDPASGCSRFSGSAPARSAGCSAR